MINWINAKDNPPLPNDEKYYLVFFNGGYINFAKYIEITPLFYDGNEGTIKYLGGSKNRWKIDGNNQISEVEYYVEITSPLRN